MVIVINTITTYLNAKKNNNIHKSSINSGNNYISTVNKNIAKAMITI